MIKPIIARSIPNRNRTQFLQSNFFFNASEKNTEDNLALPANHLESVLFDDDLFGDRKLFVITPLSVFEFFIMNYDAKVECFFNFGCV